MAWVPNLLQKRHLCETSRRVAKRHESVWDWVFLRWDGMENAETLTPEWLTKREAAERARVTPRTIENWIKWGWLRAGGTAGLVLIKPRWVDECLERRPGRRKGQRIAYGIRFDLPGQPKYAGLSDSGALTWTDSTRTAIRFEDWVDALRALDSYSPGTAGCAQIVELEATE